MTMRRSDQSRCVTRPVPIVQVEARGEQRERGPEHRPPRARLQRERDHGRAARERDAGRERDRCRSRSPSGGAGSAAGRCASPATGTRARAGARSPATATAAAARARSRRAGTGPRMLARACGCGVNGRPLKPRSANVERQREQREVDPEDGAPVDERDEQRAGGRPDHGRDRPHRGVHREAVALEVPRQVGRPEHERHATAGSRRRSPAAAGRRRSGPCSSRCRR